MDFKLDQIDHRILKVLEENADLSNKTLADQVGLSPSACLERVAQLKKSVQFNGSSQS